MHARSHRLFVTSQPVEVEWFSSPGAVVFSCLLSHPAEDVLRTRQQFVPTASSSSSSRNMAATRSCSSSGIAERRSSSSSNALCHVLFSLVHSLCSQHKGLSSGRPLVMQSPEGPAFLRPSPSRGPPCPRARPDLDLLHFLDDVLGAFALLWCALWERESDARCVFALLLHEFRELVIGGRLRERRAARPPG